MRKTRLTLGGFEEGGRGHQARKVITALFISSKKSRDLVPTTPRS